MWFFFQKLQFVPSNIHNISQESLWTWTHGWWQNVLIFSCDWSKISAQHIRVQKKVESSFKNDFNPLFVHVGTYSVHWQSRQGGEGILICNREEKMRRKISCCCSGFSCSKICGLASWSARTFLLMSHHCRDGGTIGGWGAIAPPRFSQH